MSILAAPRGNSHRKQLLAACMPLAQPREIASDDAGNHRVAWKHSWATTMRGMPTLRQPLPNPVAAAPRPCDSPAARMAVSFKCQRSGPWCKTQPPPLAPNPCNHLFQHRGPLCSQDWGAQYLEVHHPGVLPHLGCAGHALCAQDSTRRPMPLSRSCRRTSSGSSSALCFASSGACSSFAAGARACLPRGSWLSSRP